MRKLCLSITNRIGYNLLTFFTPIRLSVKSNTSFISVMFENMCDTAARSLYHFNIILCRKQTSAYIIQITLLHFIPEKISRYIFEKIVYASTKFNNITLCFTIQGPFNTYKAFLFNDHGQSSYLCFILKPTRFIEIFLTLHPDTLIMSGHSQTNALFY